MDLVNTLGIANRLGIGKSAVANWRERYENFPSPLEFPGVIGIPLWRWEDIVTWHKKTGRS